ncbi:MAG: DUF4491 family protein [Bacteroidales bacterium]|nr:DUF4491 family protein [Bacteroidales bacterium]
MLIESMQFSGLLIGVCTFLIIGVYHPIVIKTEYYFGTKCWWIFLVAGLCGVVATLFIDNNIIAALTGVFSFSSLWSIKEVFEQEQRVLKGWFPMNPKRAAYYETKRNAVKPE